MGNAHSSFKFALLQAWRKQKNRTLSSVHWIKSLNPDRITGELPLSYGIWAIVFTHIFQCAVTYTIICSNVYGFINKTHFSSPHNSVSVSGIRGTIFDYINFFLMANTSPNSKSIPWRCRDNTFLALWIMRLRTLSQSWTGMLCGSRYSFNI